MAVDDKKKKRGRMICMRLSTTADTAATPTGEETQGNGSKIGKMGWGKTDRRKTWKDKHNSNCHSRLWKFDSFLVILGACGSINAQIRKCFIPVRARVWLVHLGCGSKNAADYSIPWKKQTNKSLKQQETRVVKQKKSKPGAVMGHYYIMWRYVP